MANNLGQNSRVYIRLYKREPDGQVSATFPAVAPAINTMVDISDEGLRDWRATVARGVDDVGGNSPAMRRQQGRIVDVSQLTFSCLYNEVTSPSALFEVDAAVFNHGFCANWNAWMIVRRNGAGAGKPQTSYPLIIESALKVKDGVDSWRFNVTARGYDLPIDGVQF